MTGHANTPVSQGAGRCSQTYHGSAGKLGAKPSDTAMGRAQCGATEVSSSRDVLASSDRVSHSQQTIGELGVDIGQGRVVGAKVAFCSRKGLAYNLTATNPAQTPAQK